MRTWFALILAPLLALADQSVSYATVAWSCAHQDSLALHLVHGAFFVAIVIGTFFAWNRWRETRSAHPPSEEAAARHFLAGMATASGALSMLVIVAMWVPVWLIAPCFA